MPFAFPSNPVELDRLYNNRDLVPAFPEHMARWTRDSAALRAQGRCVLDLPYGDGPGETLDVFLPARAVPGGAPVLFFIHGGYWRSLDKADHSFVAAAFAAAGVCVVVPNYALCPAVTIPDITLQMARALAWTWRHVSAHGGDPQRITVAGHSAGGQLAPMMLLCRWPELGADLPEMLVRNALAISGLHDLEPIRLTPFLQASLHLTPGQVALASPARLPAPRVRAGRGLLYAVAGGDESAEFLRQNALIRQAWGRRVVPVCEALPGLNHFSVLESLATPGQRLHTLAMALLA